MHGKLADVQRTTGDDVVVNPSKTHAAYSVSPLLLRRPQGAGRKKPDDLHRRSLGREHGEKKQPRGV